MATSGVRSEPPLIVIVGPTASGKTALAIMLAEKYNGEIICADSRTIYKGMDIGTAKPTLDEQRRVPHWGIDLVEPGERFTVADFQQYATKKIQDIRRRKKLAIVVGGTGLYVDALLYSYQFSDSYDAELRQVLDLMTIDQLFKYCDDNNILIESDVKNKRRIIRTIERGQQSIRENRDLDNSTIVVGIATNKYTLATRIGKRSEQIFEDKIVEEATRLGKKYGWDSEAMTGNIYPIMHRYTEGAIGAKEAEVLFATSDRQLAKRQMTWFRRNPNILWGTSADISHYIDKLIARI